MNHHFSANQQKGKALTRRTSGGIRLEVDKHPSLQYDQPLAEQKGFVELLEGLLVLGRDAANTCHEMVIVGTGDHALEKKLVEIGHGTTISRQYFIQQPGHCSKPAPTFFSCPAAMSPATEPAVQPALWDASCSKGRRFADSILDLDENPEAGTGILFDSMTGWYT
jgi:starch synthase